MSVRETLINNFLDIGLQDLINISLIRSLLCLQIGEFVVCPKINLHAKFLEKVKKLTYISM